MMSYFLFCAYDGLVQFSTLESLTTNPTMKRNIHTKTSWHHLEHRRSQNRQDMGLKHNGRES